MRGLHELLIGVSASIGDSARASFQHALRRLSPEVEEAFEFLADDFSDAMMLLKHLQAIVIADALVIMRGDKRSFPRSMIRRDRLATRSPIIIHR